EMKSRAGTSFDEEAKNAGIAEQKFPERREGCAQSGRFFSSPGGVPTGGVRNSATRIILDQRPEDNRKIAVGVFRAGPLLRLAWNGPPNLLREPPSCCVLSALVVLALIRRARSSLCYGTRAMLRRPGVWSCLPHGEGCFRLADRVQPDGNVGGLGQ